MKKKIIFGFICITLLLNLFCACTFSENEINTKIQTEVQENEVSLPGVYPKRFMFLSGAGGWATYIVLESDGSFSGAYHDSEMGISGQDFDGSAYICEFSGKFGNFVKINDYMYFMSLDQLVTTSGKAGDEYIKDRIKYTVSEPYGLYGGKQFVLYTPETPVDELNEQFIWWSSSLRNHNDGEQLPEKLGVYGIYNVKTSDGFFSEQ